MEGSSGSTGLQTRVLTSRDWSCNYRVAVWSLVRGCPHCETFCFVNILTSRLGSHFCCSRVSAYKTDKVTNINSALLYIYSDKSCFRNTPELEVHIKLLTFTFFFLWWGSLWSFPNLPVVDFLNLFKSLATEDGLSVREAINQIPDCSVWSICYKSIKG